MIEKLFHLSNYYLVFKLKKNRDYIEKAELPFFKVWRLQSYMNIFREGSKIVRDNFGFYHSRCKYSLHQFIFLLLINWLQDFLNLDSIYLQDKGNKYITCIFLKP